MSTDDGTPEGTPELLVVADDPASRRLLSLILELEGFTAISQSGPADVPGHDGPQPIGAVLDLSDADDGWVDLATSLVGNGVPFLILGDGDEDSLKKRVQETGATAFLQKPFDPSTLVDTLKQMLDGRSQAS